MSRRPLSAAVRADDVEGVAIAIAADDNPALPDLAKRIDELAAQIEPTLRSVSGARRLGRLVHAVHGALRFHTPESHDDPRLHLFDHVLERRAGSPVALAVVLISIGRRLGVPLRGVAFPGHFMVRYEASSPVFIDPTSGAFPFPSDCLVDLAIRELRVRPEAAERFLAPVGARTVAVRLLRDLQRVYEDRADLGRAMLVADRIHDVTGSPSARCDRGLRAAALGAPHGALDDLRAYLSEKRDSDISRMAAVLEPTAFDLN